MSYADVLHPDGVPWWETHQNCTELSAWLIERGDLRTLWDVHAFWESSRKWSLEWALFCAERDSEQFARLRVVV